MTPEAWQVLFIILTPLSALLGAYAFRLKKQAEIETERAHAQTRRVEQDAAARIKQIDLDHQVRLKEVEIESEKNKSEAEQAKRLLDLVSNGLTGISEAVKGSTAAYQTTVDKLLQRIDEKNEQISEDQIYLNERLERALGAIEAIPEKIQASNAEFIKQFVGEFGVELARQLEVKNVNRDILQWPADDDPGWKNAVIKPTKPDVILFKTVSYDDFNRVKKACARIDPAGESVQIITGRQKGWVCVKKLTGEPCYGYLPISYIQILESKPEPAH